MSSCAYCQSQFNNGISAQNISFCGVRCLTSFYVRCDTLDDIIFRDLNEKMIERLILPVPCSL